MARARGSLAVCGQQCLPAHLPWGTASRHRSEDAHLLGETDSTGKRADVEATRPDVWLKHVPWAQFFTEVSPQGPSLSLTELSLLPRRWQGLWAECTCCGNSAVIVLRFCTELELPGCRVAVEVLLFWGGSWGCSRL